MFKTYQQVTLVLPLGMDAEFFREMVSCAFEVSAFTLPWVSDNGSETDLKVSDWDLNITRFDQKDMLELKKRKGCT